MTKQKEIQFTEKLGKYTQSDNIIKEKNIKKFYNCFLETSIRKEQNYQHILQNCGLETSSRSLGVYNELIKISFCWRIP